MKKMSYRKSIFSSLGLLYLFAYLFDLDYTNDIGFIIALGVIFYVNGGLKIFKDLETRE